MGHVKIRKRQDKGTSVIERLNPPYTYSKQEFHRLIDEFRSTGPCSSQKYNGKTDLMLVRHIKRIEYMSFGVHQWLYSKALQGDEDALFDLSYSYDLYDKIILKAKDEGLI